MGDPLLLLEAASRYRGDLEDRLTEIFATTLSEHEGFCHQLLLHLGVITPERLEVKTQQSFRDGPARIDLVIRGYDRTGWPTAVVFIESKYNPRKLVDSYWFDDDQAGRQARALGSQPAAERRLVALASDHDLRKRPVPAAYEYRLGWREIGDLANRAGGMDGWQVETRRSNESVAQRVLLEFWSYLKGDAVGALNEDDLFVLGGTVRAEDRVTTLLEHAAEDLGWDDEVSDDWVTAGEAPIQYVTGDAPPETWVAGRRDGLVYALVSGAEWTDESPEGRPHVYAGCGFSAKREERDSVAKSDWPSSLATQGLLAIFDPDGIYVFGARPLSEIVEQANTLSGQVGLLVTWIQEIVESVLSISGPPELGDKPKGPRARAASRRPSG